MGRSLSEVSRREERIFVNLPVALRPTSPGGSAGEGRTIDCSPRGLRVRTELPFQAGQILEVKVSDGQNISQNYRVMWVREPNQQQSEYQAGLELLLEPVV